MLDMAATCLNAASLIVLARMRLNRKQAARVAQFAAKANDGLLTPAERAECASYAYTRVMLATLQSNGRLTLKRVQSV